MTWARSASAKLVEIIYQQGIAAPSWESADLTELFLLRLISNFYDLTRVNIADIVTVTKVMIYEKLISN